MQIQPFDYAQAATEHAFDRHSIRLSLSDLSSIDLILDRERRSGASEDREALILCYGAWFGEWMVQRVNGLWVGLSEPVPPRIRVNGMDYSPIDAVRRRLVNENAPRLCELIDRVTPADSDEHCPKWVRQVNQAAWDSLSSDARFANRSFELIPRSAALAALDPWLRQGGSIEGQRVLCLAAGGGTHAPLLAMAGALVTVVDFSPRLLDIDQQIAREFDLHIQTIQTAMDDLSMFALCEFDCVVQPVSSCYVGDLGRVFAEVWRVLKCEGLYVSQHKQPASMQAVADFRAEGYLVCKPNADGHPLPPQKPPAAHREHGTYEFIHTLDAMLGGMCRQGFVIEDLQEPTRGDAWAPKGNSEHRATLLPPYLKIKARRL